jgi:hypothetical protein
MVFYGVFLFGKLSCGHEKEMKNALFCLVDIIFCIVCIMWLNRLYILAL